MKRSPISSRLKCAVPLSVGGSGQCRCGVQTIRYGLAAGLLAFALCFAAAPAFGQIQSTISCPQGQGYWDILSVMMMDPGLAANYHMEGLTNGLPSAYMYTIWAKAQNKIYYVKNP